MAADKETDRNVRFIQQRADRIYGDDTLPDGLALTLALQLEDISEQVRNGNITIEEAEGKYN